MSETAGMPVVAAPVRAHAVRFTGGNLDEVRAVVLAGLLDRASQLPDGYDFAIGWPEHSNPTAIKLWDFRSERWAYAMPGEWVVVFDTGVLVLDEWWFRALFDGHAAAPDRLSQAAELAARLSELLAVREAAPRAAPADTLSPVNLRPVPQHHSGPAMPVPVVGDVWRDASGKTWAVRHVPDDGWWTADCRDEDGLRWFWSVLWQYYAPLTLVQRTASPTAA